MTLQDLKDKKLMLFETISGSRAYNIHKPESDFDFRGIYILPIENLFGYDYIPQISDKKNDSVYYEIGRFLDLLRNQNPNIIELFNMPEENVIYKHPLFDDILKYRKDFLSKLCKESFCNYAASQIQKARGLKKKIVNPIPKERKSILNFCYVIVDYNTIPIKRWFEMTGHIQEHCGLVNLQHARDTYALFYNESIGYNGITNANDTSNRVRLSAIPKGEKCYIIMIYNQDEYSRYCREYKEYWDWEDKKNLDRYNTNITHGKSYDSKNMCHCIRLIRMAGEIAERKEVIVRRPDAAELMEIRNGDREYDDILSEANIRMEEIEKLYAKSDLPDAIDPNFVNELLISFRKRYYSYTKVMKNYNL